MDYLLGLAQPYRDLAFAGAELGALLITFGVLRLCFAFLRPRRVDTPTRRDVLLSRAHTAAAALLIILFLTLGAAVLGFDTYLVLQGEEVVGGTLRRVEALPPDLPIRIVLVGAKIVGLLAVTGLVLWAARWALSALQRAAQRSERITANDAAVGAFFGLLRKVIATTAWLLALTVVARWLPFPESVPAFLGLATRIYLVAAVGLLCVRAIASAVDTADALSMRFARPETPLRHYHHLRGLVPLLRRCLELAIWLAVASIILLQIEPVASLAIWGPRLIQALGVFFLARVAAEAANLAIDRAQGDVAGLTEIQQQQRATLVPLLKSFARGAIFFAALVVALAVLDLNPFPLLAGAGILGVVVGFGAQPVITDVVSGFFILFENQFLVGDYVEVGSARGVVESIQLRTTTIRDPNGQQHIVRNGQMSGVVNYSKAYTFAVVEVEVGYDADLRFAYDVLGGTGSEFAGKHPDVLEPLVIAGIEKFTKDGLVIRTTTKVRPGTHGQVARDLREAILVAFAKHGLKMPAATAA